jgi:hypothetical protein
VELALIRCYISGIARSTRKIKKKAKFLSLKNLTIFENEIQLQLLPSIPNSTYISATAINPCFLTPSCFYRPSACQTPTHPSIFNTQLIYYLVPKIFLNSLKQNFLCVSSQNTLHFLYIALILLMVNIYLTTLIFL